MSILIQPPGPGVAEPLRSVLQGYYEALQQILQPGQPVQLAEIATQADLLALAPAASYPNCAIVVTDLNTIAVSTNVAGTWTWRRADGSAL